MQTLLQGGHSLGQCDQGSWGTDPERLRFSRSCYVLHLSYNTVLHVFTDMDQEYYHGKNDGPVTLLLAHWYLC